MRRIINLIITAGALCVGAAQAGSFFFDFNTDPTTSGLVTITGAGTWQPSGGVGAATNANDGYLVISAGTSQVTRMIFSDFDSGSVVQGFDFEADLRVGNGTESPADGFSVNYCRSDDPVLAGGAFATGQNCEADLPEEGTQTGIAIGLDAWDSGGTPGSLCGVVNQNIGVDVAAVTVRVDGILVLQNACPTRNPTDPADPTSIQTGPYDGTGSIDPLTWQHLKVQLGTDAKLNVYWKGVQILTNYQTTYFPSPGRLVFAGRCGGSWENQHVDNIAITTIPAQNVLPGQATGLGNGVSVQFFDSGAGQVDVSKGATISLDGGATVPASAFVKNATTSTVFYYGYPTFLVAGSQHTITATVQDTLGRSVTASNLTFTVGAYSVVDSAPAVTGVDTTKLGFRLRTYQTTNSIEPNDIWWANEQLNGLQGANQADTSSFTDNGYFDFVKNDSIGLAGYPNFDYGVNSDGVFTFGNGYPEAAWPGLTEGNPNLAIDNSSAELLCFLKFQNPGVYYMGVNSDDGFDVTVGPNPADWGSTSLGSFNGGRGASGNPDAFTFVITNTDNFYPVRMMWENGTGGANAEWFTVKDGTRILLNDPSPTNNSGVTAYYSGPALPAFVSDLRPNPNRTSNRGDQFNADITDLGTTVTGTPTLYLDGALLTTAVVSKSGAVTTIGAPPGFLLSIGAHSAQVIYSTSGGGPFTNSWNFTVGGYFIPAWAVTGVDETKPGFRLKPYQTAVWPNTATQPNNNRWTIEQLSGLHGPNAANLTTATDGGYIDFIADPSSAPATINFNIAGTGSAGNFGNDFGIPGLTLGTDIPDTGNQSFDLVCFLRFSAAGAYTLGVNSDDGFAVYAGANPSDWARSALLGEFSGGRGPADTTFTVFVAAPGIYPVRLFWENGNGSASGGNGAECEWFVVQPDGTRVLINDPAVDTGVKAFYSGPALPAYISAMCPANGATGVLPYPMATGLAPNAFGVQLTDGSTTVTPGSIAVTINGATIVPVVAQSSTTPKVTTVTLPMLSPLTAGTNTAVFVYTTTGASGAGTFTNTWGFTVGTAPTLVNSAWAVTGVDTTKVGFQYRPWQSAGQPNTVWWTEEQLAGLHGPNNANLSILNDGAYLDYLDVVNFDIGTSHDGNFVPQTAFFPNRPDINFPGIPGANNQTDNSSIEMLAYLQFTKPGVYTMGVNSDDGFKVTVGPNPADWFALNVGQYNGGKGASDVLFSFVIPTAGFYPFRLIWENGGGGCNCEWFMVNADGSKILINDTAPPESTAVTAYYKGPGLAAGITAVTPTPGTTDGLGSLQVKLADGTPPVTAGSITLTIDNVAVTPTTSHANGITLITYDQLATGPHSVTLCYSTAAGGPFCTTWGFTTSAAPDGGVVLSTNLWTPPGSGSNPGFAIKVFQTANTNIFNGWQNIARMADMAIQGLYGGTVADLTDYTNNGAMWWPSGINFSQNGAGALTDNGDFRNSAFPDSVVPGLGVWDPTTVGGTQGKMDNDCMEVKAFIEFPTPGYYVMGVNSDDGFRVTEGDQGSPGKSPLAILAPAGLAGEVTSMYTTTADEGNTAGFGAPPPSTVPIIARVVLADPIDASTPLVNAAALNGNIAFIQRGVVGFTVKYDAARDAGAVAVIIGNNAANDTAANTYPGTMGGSDATNTIPALFVNYAIGTNLMANATTTSSSTLIARITAQDCSPVAGQINQGKGASDVLFGITVPQAGVYPFRLVWENGGGDANCEWFIRNTALGDFLVGDPASPIKAWITRNVNFAGALPAPVMTTPFVSGNNVMVGWTGEGELWEAYSAAGPWFKSTFKGNPATVVPNSLVPDRFFRVRQY